MIYIDIDGVCVDFVGTAKEFGVELEHNEFGVWKWGEPITPAEFYAVAEPQEWLDLLLEWINEADCFGLNFLTIDNSEVKRKWIEDNIENPLGYPYISVYEAPDKSVHCEHPTDLLIDDNAAECERWRDKGGIAYWFNLAEDDPFGKFLKWWRLK